MILDLERVRAPRVRSFLVKNFKQLVPDLKVVPAQKLTRQAAATGAAEPAVIVADLHHLRTLSRGSGEELSKLLAVLHHRPTGILALLRTPRDQQAACAVDMAIRNAEGRLWLIQIKESEPLEGQLAAQVGLWTRILDSFSPRYLTCASYLPPAKVFLRFGDNFAGVLRLADIGLDAPGLNLHTIHASAEGDSFEIYDAQGEVHDVDASALRARLDKGHGRTLAQQNQTVRIEVGKRIHAARRSRGMSQAALSAATDVAQEVISRIETGKQTPRLETLQKLAYALGASVESMLAGTAG